MSTLAQIEANRRNSQKSTGPTSSEGKAASSLNALKTGIHAGSHVIRGEDPAELQALTAEFLLHHHPADPNQRALVDTLIAAEWTQRRLRRIEAQLWEYQVECLDKNLSHADYLNEAIQHNSPLGHAYQDALEAFSRLQRRIECTNRMYLRNLAVLQDLQKTSPHQPSTCPVEAEQPAGPVPEPACPEQTESLTSQIGFVLPIVPVSPEPPRQPHPNQPPIPIRTS